MTAPPVRGTSPTSRSSSRASIPTAGPCSYFWTFDPDVLGDTVTDEGILYYGSYYGGMFATEVNFTETGVTAATADTADDTRIAIGNRYEGANVVYRDGYYYLFASATNCCNGALTGYSVFVGRSTSPFGPFLDREGNSFLDAAVGGTPFLTMNGNRWVGTGHNTVFVDEAGQWWTIYHAVDQEDPFFAFDPGFTKRPALLDPIDWVNGWPTVNGGAGASDTKMPAPAAQEGERSRYKTKLVKPLVVNRLLESDEFGGTSLSSDWSWAEGRTGDVTVSDGVLRWEVEHTDLYVDSNTASVLVRDAPTRDYVVETKVRLSGLPDEGCCFNYAQAGLVIYGDDDNFIKLTDISIWETRQTEFAKELNPGSGGVEPLRQHRRRSARGRLDLPAHRRGAPERCRAARGRRGHGALHRLHQPGRRDVGAGRRLDAQPRRRADRPGLDGRNRPGDRAPSPRSSTTCASTR